MLLALSLNIISGYAGQPNLGHAAFFGIGAYTSAILTANYAVPFLAALLLSGILTSIFGALIGMISLRIKEAFFAVTTIGVNFIVVAVFHYVPLFGASFGLKVPRAVLFGQELHNNHFLILIVIMIVLVVLFCRVIESSWLGMALGGIRNNEEASNSIGISSRKFKVISFVIATFIAGITGSIYAHFMGFICSTDFQFLTSLAILSMAVVGGLGTIRGPLVGAIILELTPEVFRFVSEFRFLVYGGLLLLMMRFQPQGLIGNGSIIWNFFKKGIFKYKQARGRC